MSFLSRGAAGLCISALLVAGLAPGAHADNLDADSLVSGVASFGDVCRGTTASGGVRFTLRRTGNLNQSWGNSALVTVAPKAQPSPLTLGSTSGTTSDTWVAAGNNVEVDAGSAATSVNVPENAPLGARTALVTYAATGAGAGGGTTTRERLVTFSWNVVDCAPADTTPPVIGSVVTPAVPDGANGWYRTDVSVDWTVTDAQSAVTLDGCQDAALTSDGSLTSSCSATSAGGSAGPVGVTVKRDATPPSVEAVVSGDIGDNGWYVGDVDVSWNIDEATSGVATTSADCSGATLAEDTASNTYTCTVTDEAGNRTATSVEIKRDATDPVIGSTVSGSLGGEGWFRGDVDVSWTVEDATSQVASTTGCEDAVVTEDTKGAEYTCVAVDRAGNEESSSVTVKRDTTAPAITFTRTGREGENGWFRGPVDLVWTVTDGGSTLASTVGCGPQAVGADGEHEFTCSATDGAGNTAQATAEVHKDTQAPTVTPDLDGKLGANGWYVGNVSVAWVVSDATSGAFQDEDCVDGTVEYDTSGSGFACSVTDVAGNSASASVVVKRDATPPAIDPALDGTLGANSWYVGDVSVGWDVSDATSGVVKGAGCPDGILTEDSLGRVFDCSITDNAGNPANASVEVKRDATDPVITETVGGTLGGGGWYTTDVEVTWTVTDATSDVGSSSGCERAGLTEDSDGVTYTCSAADNAGNTDSSSVTVKRDATAPTIGYALEGDGGDGGWYTGPVNLDWTVADARSGVAKAVGCDDVNIAADGRHSVTCAVTDGAGNEKEVTVEVLIDATAPTITPSVSGQLGSNGWYTGNATVTWTLDDATSGVDDARASGCESATVSSDTTGTTFTCSATDLAGNPASRSVTVKRDATAPELTLTGGPADGATYDFGDVPPPSTCTASDATSEMAGPCTVTAGATTVGAGTQVATATDQAGNVTTLSRSYTVSAWRLDGFYKPVTMGTTVVNTVKAGSTVPLKFNVYKGGTPMASGIDAKFTTTKRSCDTGDAEDAVDFVTTGSTALRYDSVAGQWVQNWATPAGGKGSCYRVTMTTADGTSITADFKLK